MLEPLTFSGHTLPNGIEVVHHPHDSKFTVIHVQIPLGAMHCVDPIIPGAAHFLEHMALECSELFPEQGSFHRFVGLKGGYLNASTGPRRTTYVLDVPTRHLDETLPGFLAAVFRPVFKDEVIALHRGIVRNERKGKERWYPGSNELSQYLFTQWMWSRPYPLRQLIGEDEDLARLTPEILREMHRYYFDPRIKVVVGGNASLDHLVSELSALPLSQHELPGRMEPLRWVNQQYHERGFRDVSRHQLYYGGFVNTRPEPRESRAIDFILGYLHNTIHGPVNQWLRKETGWVYETWWNSGVSPESREWRFCLPLDNAEHVAAVRQELWPRVEAALRDEAGVGREVDRLLDTLETYDFQTLGSIMDAAIGSLNTHGRIITATEWLDCIAGCRDTRFLEQVYRTYFNQELSGSFCAHPLEG